jgi:3-carboxy-cis,cis-muconate cycloisomerase
VIGDLDPAVDSGLLSPVRAGTAIEQVVGDRAWLQAMLDAEAALARAQARVGTLPAESAAVITRTARAELFDIRGIALAARDTANPVVALVGRLTRAVAELDPASAEYVHRGSTSQDILDTAAMTVAHRALTVIDDRLADAAEALAGLARTHRDVPMAGRTLALHAGPTTFGLKAAGWRRLLVDARARLRVVRDEGLPVSLGGAVGTLAGYLEYAALAGVTDPRYPDRLVAAFAEETGLCRPALPWHTLRTPLADLAAVLAFVTGALGKIAIDVLSLARSEVAEVAEPAALGRGASSAMPHKRNPVFATLIRSAALQVPALATGLTQALLSEDERSAGGWHAEWLLLRECLRLTGGAAETAVTLCQGLVVRPERMAANLTITRGRITSERLAARLSPALGRGLIKDVLVRASAEAEATARSLFAVLAEAPELRDRYSAEELARIGDPVEYLGAAGHLVDGSLGDRAGAAGVPQRGPAASGSGLEQLDQVAGRVGEQDLPAAGARDELAAERQPGGTQPVDLGLQVVHDQVDPVAAGTGGLRRRGPGARAGGPGQQEAQPAAPHVGERGGEAGVDLETEVSGVEVDGRLDVVDDVADADVLVSRGHG